MLGGAGYILLSFPYYHYFCLKIAVDNSLLTHQRDSNSFFVISAPVSAGKLIYPEL